MAEMQELTYEEFKQRYATDPQNVGFPVHKFGEQFGMTWEEVKGELTSGRLVATGESFTAPDGRSGYRNVMVTFDNVVAWMMTKQGEAFYRRRFPDTPPLPPEPEGAHG